MIFKRRLLTLICAITFIFTLYTPQRVAMASQSLYVAGIPAGFTIKTCGAEVIGLSEIISFEGNFSPSKEVDISIGDIITKIGNEEISGASSIAKILQTSKGEPLEITVVRHGEILTKILTPRQDKDGKYKLGLFLREDLNGIGTITYFKENKEFCALGHPIITENQDILNLKSGEAYEASIIGLTQGEKGKAGELRGIFLDDSKIGCFLSLYRILLFLYF